MTERKKVDLSQLRELFERRGKEDYWARIEQAFVFWIKIVETGEFRLAVEDQINIIAYRAAVVKATGRDVAKVVFVSFRDLFLKQGRMSKELYYGEDDLRDILGDSIDVVLNYNLGINHWPGLGHNIAAAFWGILGRKLGDRLEDSIGAILGNNLLANFFYICKFVFVGDEENLECLLALLKVQEQAIGLGFKKDEPETFIALCA